MLAEKSDITTIWIELYYVTLLFSPQFICIHIREKYYLKHLVKKLLSILKF